MTLHDLGWKRAQVELRLSPCVLSVLCAHKLWCVKCVWLKVLLKTFVSFIVFLLNIIKKNVTDIVSRLAKVNLMVSVNEKFQVWEVERMGYGPVLFYL